MSVIFARGIDGPDEAPWQHLQPQEWCPAPAFYLAAGWAFTCCPNGHFGTLSQIHTCDETGVLSPSYVCPQCSFHEWVQLDVILKQAAPPAVAAEGQAAGETQ